MPRLPIPNPEEDPTAHNQVAGKFIFGNSKKLALGIWVVEREVGEPFSAQEAVLAFTQNPSVYDSQISGFLRDFADFNMLERLSEPSLRIQRYTRQDHPLWSIYLSARDAFQVIAERR